MSSVPARPAALRARRALAVAAPVLVGAVLAASAVGYGTQRARLEADVAVASAAAAAVGPVHAAVHAQLAAPPRDPPREAGS